MTDLRTLIGNALADAERVGYHKGAGGITVQDLRHAQGSREWLEEETDRQFGELRAENARLRKEVGSLRERLLPFLAAIGASAPDDHPWVREARALAGEVSALTPAPEPSHD